MPTLERACLGIKGDKTKRAPGYEAHQNRYGPGRAMAELMAKGEPGPMTAAFNIWRFREGQFIDESVAAGVAH